MISAEIEACQAAGDWDEATRRMIDAAQRLERGGAACLLICTNTMHKMAAAVQDAVGIPLLHIADATAGPIKAASVARPLLLATRYTMEQDFYKGYLRDRHGIDARVPDETDRALVHDIIYDELCQGIVRPESKARYLDLVDRETGGAADGVILGCTEVGLLISQEDLAVPVFDTTALHAAAAVAFALGETSDH